MLLVDWPALTRKVEDTTNVGRYQDAQPAFLPKGIEVAGIGLPRIPLQVRFKTGRLRRCEGRILNHWLYAVLTAAGQQRDRYEQHRSALW